VEPIVFVLVAGAAVLHVTWNVLLKTAGNPLRAAAVGMTTAGALLIPAATVGWFLVGRPVIPTEAIGLGALSGLLEAAYFAFLAAAYRRGDLSVVYPLARGTAPLLAVALGQLVLNEHLGLPGIVGVVLLLVGLAVLQRPWRFLQASGRAGSGAAGFALLTGVTIAAYSAVDRVGVRQTEPWIYAALIWASCIVFLWTYVWWSDRRKGSARATTDDPEFVPSRAAVGGMITLAAYLLILFAFSVAPLTAVAPLRESAIVLASGWGALRLGEASSRADAARRIAASAIVVMGSVLLALE
jgi:drug/metabolite transporter (DMT)-like permease